MEQGTNYGQIREVWLDQQDQYIEPTHCIEFYRAWSMGEIRRELRFGSILTAYAITAQLVDYMQNHSLAGLTLCHWTTPPNSGVSTCVEKSSEAEKDHEAQDAVLKTHPTFSSTVSMKDVVRAVPVPSDCGEHLVAIDFDKTFGSMLDRFITDVLVPDNTSVMQLLLQTNKDIAVSTNCISMASLTYTRNCILKWQLVPTKLLATAKSIHALMVDLDSIEHSPKPKLCEVLGMELICTGGPADQTWIPDTPDIMVLADNIGARYMAEPWIVSFTVKENKDSLTISCRKVDEITNPRGVAVMWLVETKEID